ncbi:hypothetical protein P691DRAFT_812761, partial [Macrolepiota fuliginosa MF-IS2]
MHSLALETLGLGQGFATERLGVVCSLFEEVDPHLKTLDLTSFEYNGLSLERILYGHQHVEKLHLRDCDSKKILRVLQVLALNHGCLPRLRHTYVEGKWNDQDSSTLSIPVLLL